MTVYDFRSDTVSKPTPAMREAMAQAEVGDDVYGDDPTVNELQEKAADLTGHEAAIFVTSGTMGNLTAILAHCQRGDEVILGNQAHSFLLEAGGLAALGGVHPMPLTNQPDGTLDLAEIESAIRKKDDPHYPRTSLVTIENTHNRKGGAVLSVDYTNQVVELAHQHDLALHIDGARIFNAAVALGVPVKELTQNADSVTFCLSKALSAPVGSLVCGSKDFVYQVHRLRKQLGGGMRQAGILAAAGLVALDTMVDRLAEDHQRAKKLAQGLNEIPGITVEDIDPPSNLVFFSLDDGADQPVSGLIGRAKSKGLLLGSSGKNRYRMVLHVWLDDHAVSEAIKIVSSVV